MPVTSKTHGCNISITDDELNDSDKFNNLKNLVDFLGNVKSSTFFGFINDPARIRAKKNSAGKVTLEARTGTIFGIIYKKLTAKSSKAKKERTEAKKLIENIIKPYEKITASGSIFVQNIKKILDKTDSEFSRKDLYDNLCKLSNHISGLNDKDILEIEKKNNCFINNGFKIRNNPIKSTDLTTPNLLTPSNVLTSPNSSRTLIGKNPLTASTALIEPTNISRFSNFFKSDASFFISSKKNIKQIDADLYVRPSRLGMLIFSGQIISTRKTSGDGLIEYHDAYQDLSEGKRSYTLSAFETENSENESDKEVFIKKLVSKYINSFAIAYLSIEPTAIRRLAIEPVTFRDSITNQYEVRALLIAVNEFKKNHINSQFLIISSGPVKNALIKMAEKIPDFIENFQIQK